METVHQTRNEITEGVIWKQLLLFFFPILLGTFFQQLYNTIDSVIVGQFVGKEALASVGGSSAQIVSLVVGFFTGLSSGAAVTIAQFVGARKEKNANAGLHNAYAIAAFGGIALTFVGILTAPFLLRLMNTPADIMGGSLIYLRIYFAGILFVLIYNMGSAILRATGDSKSPLYVLIICCIISLSTGSSWTTSATVGIALIGIAKALGVSPALTAGAILSGAYFGDKMSPLSDTTNLAPAMAGTDLFTHIRYMTITTIPTISITLIIFIIIGLNIETTGSANPDDITHVIRETFTVSPWLLVVPIVVIGLIVKKTPPFVALLIGTLLGALAAVIAQPDILVQLSGAEHYSFKSAYKGVFDMMTVHTEITTENETMSNLLSSGGIAGMLSTVWLIICAMVFGGAMDAIGALAKISEVLLKMFHTTFGLFASTVASCLALNVTASDQYLALVVPGKMYAEAYRDRGLAPENLSRTLEDSGSVTSVLVPWNTCGAYHSGVLGVSTSQYFMYCFFNYLSPFMTLIVAATGYKIKTLTRKGDK